MFRQADHGTEMSKKLVSDICQQRNVPQYCPWESNKKLLNRSQQVEKLCRIKNITEKASFQVWLNNTSWVKVPQRRVSGDLVMMCFT